MPKTLIINWFDNKIAEWFLVYKKNSIFASLFIWKIR